MARLGEHQLLRHCWDHRSAGSDSTELFPLASVAPYVPTGPGSKHSLTGTTLQGTSRRTSKEPAGNQHGTSMELAEKEQGTNRDPAGNQQGTRREPAGNQQGTSREPAGN